MKSIRNEYRAEVPAKLNLSLAITGKRDGLHLLDMITYPYERYKDVAVFEPSDVAGLTEIKASASFEGFDEARFVAFFEKKAQAIAKRLEVGGRLTIIKNIPLGAGLGGSSASIVASAVAMQEYCDDIGKSSALDAEFLLSLGSDVPCMKQGGICRVQGVGERVTKLDYDKRLDFDLKIAPGGGDTAKCYALYDELQQADNGMIPDSVEEALACNRNDLYAASVSLNPSIAEAVMELKEKYGEDKKVYMSGSGSAVFVVL